MNYRPLYLHTFHTRSHCNLTPSPTLNAPPPLSLLCLSSFSPLSLLCRRLCLSVPLYVSSMSPRCLSVPLYAHSACSHSVYTPMYTPVYTPVYPPVALFAKGHAKVLVCGQVRNNLLNTFILPFNTYKQPINTFICPPYPCATSRPYRTV